MKYLPGKERSQMTFFVLKRLLPPKMKSGIIDAFVEQLPLKDFGFKIEFVENGRPAYHPAELLKLFLYGYLNRIRSSRALEKECKRNLEVMWLMKELRSDHTKKTTKRASADIGLIYCAFNLRRIINLVGKSALKAWLKALTVIFPSNARHFKPNSALLILSQQAAAPKSTLPIAA